MDLITFGSPCQDLSVAGKRAGLKHESNGDAETTRSGLFMEAVRIIKEMRDATNGKYPRFILWENVPGAFSSNKGEDFRIVLEEIIKIIEPQAVMPEVPQNGWPYADSYRGHGWSLSYRVLDSQYWGVPQRRRRIYLVADFGSERAGEILFKREGLRGDLAQGGTPRQGAAANAENGVGTESGQRDGTVGFLRQLSGVEAQHEVSPTLLAAAGESGNNKPCVSYKETEGNVLYQRSAADSNVAATICASYGTKWNGNSGAYNGENFVIGIKNSAVAINQHAQTDSWKLEEDDTVQTLPAAMGMGGGHGPLIVESMGIDGYNGEITGDKSATLGVNCGTSTGRNGVMQTVVIDSIGGQAESAKETDVAPTLKASHYKSPPSVMMSAGFCTEHSAKARGVGFEEETSPTLRAGVTPAVVYDARGNGTGDKVATITGGHESSISDYTNVVVEPICFEPGAASRMGGYCYENYTGTLRATMGDNQFAVVYDGANITSPVNAANPQLGDPCHTLSTDSRNYCVVPKAKLASGKDVSGTLMASGYDKLGGQEMFSGDYTVIEETPVYCLQGNGIDRADTAGCNGKGWKEDSSYTLNTIDRPAVAYKEPVKTNYIVRRLTPTECARLQGFPDAWGTPDKKEDFTNDEYGFWLNVRNTHAAINGKLVKDYTKAQMLTWYNKLHTDSAEYKMWGNGIALPTALYCLEGIAEALNEGK